MTDSEKRNYMSGKSWFDSLSDERKSEFGDSVVLGTYEWEDFFEQKPPSGFYTGACRAFEVWQAR